jgi:hypothetical protein
MIDDDDDGGSDDCGAVSGMRIGRGNQSTWGKPAPVALCPPHISQGDRTQASMVGIQLPELWHVHVINLDTPLTGRIRIEN